MTTSMTDSCQISTMKTKLLLLISVSLQLHAFASSADEGYVAHEWGTFTSVQGADGIQLEWNPLVTSELPEFVYDRNRPNGNTRGARPFAAFASKTSLVTKQRMETPVIYFYSDRERTVDVTVRMPDGLITEWFPQVKQAGPFSTTNAAEIALARQSHLRWSDVRILPAKANAPLVKALPGGQPSSHYYAARGADADLLRVPNGAKTELEKFLFYRGVGYFNAPLQVSLSGNEDQIYLSNSGSNALSHLFILQVSNGEGKFLYVDNLPAGESKNVRLQPGKNLVPLAELRERISGEMKSALVKEGLYESEAAAMVATWRDSWFEEQGLRVLYTLPRSWTDQILPLTIEPKPRDVVRVMVGRAEVITPTMEWELLKQIVHYSDNNTEIKAQAVEDLTKLGLGRFTEPAVRRVTSHYPSREFSQNAWELLQVSSPKKPKTLAQQ